MLSEISGLKLRELPSAAVVKGRSPVLRIILMCNHRPSPGDKLSSFMVTLRVARPDASTVLAIQVRKRPALPTLSVHNEVMDVAAFENARLARDARYDGCFFIGVTSTGIYCRPICPAPPPKASHVRYFLSAAAAAEAGFRPCLRCRPEAAPGTPAWMGSSASVSRALRLIDEGALDRTGVNDLAARLGIGARHLRRLFLRHLGATPIAVAQTRRLHFAKRLIDETSLPMTEVALASGFSSVRRFNAIFRKLYGRTPTELRAASPASQVQREPGHYTFLLSYRPPCVPPRQDTAGAANAESEGLRHPSTIGSVLPRFNEVFRRKISIDGRSGRVVVRPVRGKNQVELQIEFPKAAALLRIVNDVRRRLELS
jgi:AraC family transcriptional regulator of adaptative response / DNA-3-methyladenine glycosylase II